MASHRVGTRTPSMPVLSRAAAYVARVISDKPKTMYLRVESHKRDRGAVSLRQTGSEHHGGSMPIAIPAVSSYAIGPRDMGMLTGDILHGSS